MMKCRPFTMALLAALVCVALSVPVFSAGPNENSNAAKAPDQLTSMLESDNSTVYQIEDTPLAATVAADENAPVLKDVRTVEQGGQTLLIKTWDAPAGYDADKLVEADFEKGGLYYKKAYLLMASENYDDQKKLASETVTVSHENKNDVIGKLQPIVEYSQDGFTGQLTLKADAIVTEAAGKSSYSYAVNDVREYTGLERNDPYYVPKSVEKNGVTLQLVDIGWSQMGEGNYKATASYSGSATGTSVTGYTSKATYVGEVSKKVLDSITYTVVYEGSLIPPPPFDFSPYLIAGGSVLLFLTAAFIVFNKRDNTKVYALIGKEYQLVHKQKITPLSPIIDLSPKEISGQSEEFMIVLGRLAVRKLRGQCVKIIGTDGMMKEHRIFKVRSFHIGQHLEEDFV